VLPDAKHSPTCGPQSFRRILVASFVRLDLLVPESSIGFRPRSMPRAAVPKATIYEYSKPISWKNDVDGPASSWQQSFLFMITKPLTMQQGTNLALERIV